MKKLSVRPHVHIFAGKGGVGKTTTAVSLGTALADRGQKTAIVDYDGGHSVRNTLGLQTNIPTNTICPMSDNLFVIVIDQHKFYSIVKSKQLNMSLDEYLGQFPQDLGIIPFADMLHHFFGAPTDVDTVQKFALLVGIVHELTKDGFAHIVIDVEPTAGFERLLLGMDAMVRSLKNLKDSGKLFLAALGVKWPDIAGYLRSDYISNIDKYAARISDAVGLLREAEYLIVCTPERGPVDQAFEVKKIIKGFGGSVRACIMNNIRGERHEAVNIIRAHELSDTTVYIARKPGLHLNHTGPHRHLREIGGLLLTHLSAPKDVAA